MKNRKAKKKNQTRRWIITIAAVLVLTALIGTGAVLRHNSQITAQSNSFHNAKDFLVGVADEVAAGVPGGRRMGVAYCDRSSEKYAKGTRYCVTNEIIIYELNSTKDAESKSEIVHVSLKGVLNEDLKLTQDHTSAEQIKTYIFNHEIIGCSVSYYALDGSLGWTYSKALNPEESVTGLLVSLSCSSDAKADYFQSID